MYTSYHELEKLVAFAKYKSLSKAADHLLISEPALSKSLHKLESELQVRLFKQYPNKLVLTDTGKLAAKKADKLLQENQAFQQDLKKYEDKNHSILASVNSPGLAVLLEKNPLPIKATEIKAHSAQEVATLLLNNTFDLVISNHRLQQRGVKSKYLGTENLFVNFPQSQNIPKVPLAKITAKNLPGIIVLNNMGVWENIFQRYAPHTLLIKQDSSEMLNKIHQLSDFPFISSNIYSAIKNPNFTSVLVEDPHFHLKLFLNYRENDVTKFRDLVSNLRKQLQ